MLFVSDRESGCCLTLHGQLLSIS